LIAPQHKEKGALINEKWKHVAPLSVLVALLLLKWRTVIHKLLRTKNVLI